MVLELAMPFAEEDSARHRWHHVENAAVQLVQYMVHFEGLDRSRELTKEGNNVRDLRICGSRAYVSAFSRIFAKSRSGGVDTHPTHNWSDETALPIAPSTTRR